jgi:hypothetical protein
LERLLNDPTLSPMKTPPDEKGQGAELRDGGQPREQRAQPDPDDVGACGEDDGSRRQVVGPVGMERRVHAEDAQEILAEHGRDAAERGRADEHQLRPSVEE